MKYLGVWPKEVPAGESKLMYYFKAGVGKVSPSNKTLLEASK